MYKLNLKFRYFNIDDKSYGFYYENYNKMLVIRDEVLLNRVNSSETDRNYELIKFDFPVIRKVKTKIKNNSISYFELYKKQKELQLNTKDNLTLAKNDFREFDINKEYISIKTNLRNLNKKEFFNYFQKTTKDNYKYNLKDSQYIKNKDYLSVFINKDSKYIKNKDQLSVFINKDGKYIGKIKKQLEPLNLYVNKSKSFERLKNFYINKKKDKKFLPNLDKNRVVNSNIGKDIPFFLDFKKSRIVKIDSAKNQGKIRDNLKLDINKISILFTENRSLNTLESLEKPRLYVNKTQNKTILKPYNDMNKYFHRIQNKKGELYREDFFLNKKLKNLYVENFEGNLITKIDRNTLKFPVDEKDIFLNSIKKEINNDVLNKDISYYNLKIKRDIKNYKYSLKENLLTYNKRNIHTKKIFDDLLVNKIFNKKGFTSEFLTQENNYLQKIFKYQAFIPSDENNSILGKITTIKKGRFENIFDNDIFLNKISKRNAIIDIKENLLKKTIKYKNIKNLKEINDFYLTKIIKNNQIILKKDLLLEKVIKERPLSLENEQYLDKKVGDISRVGTLDNFITNFDKKIHRNLEIEKLKDNFGKVYSKQIFNRIDKDIVSKKLNNRILNIKNDFYITKNNKEIFNNNSLEKQVYTVNKNILLEQTENNLDLYKTLWFINGSGETDYKVVPNVDFEYPSSIEIFDERPNFTYLFEYLSIEDVYIDGEYIIELYDWDYNRVSTLKIDKVVAGDTSNDIIYLNIENVARNLNDKTDSQFKFTIKVTYPQVNFIIVRQPITPNKNIVLYTATERFLGEVRHPIPFGNDLGIKEIPVHINIMVEFINILMLIWQKRYIGFTMHTGREAIQGICKIVYKWLTLETSMQHPSINEYLRCYRWMRWEAEKVYNLAKADLKLNGNKWIRILILEMIDYLEMHHIDVVPILNDIRDTDYWRNVFTDVNNDINVLLDKEKGARNYVVTNTKITGSAKNI